jgi:hypothetical protein
VTTVRVYGGKPNGSPRERSPLLAGILAGAVLTLAWVVLARMTHNDVGLASWGVGGVLGIVIAKTARPPSRSTGVTAVLLTAVMLLAAKMAVVVFALQPALRDEVVQDHDTTALMYLYEMTKNHSFSPELQRTIDTRPDLVRDSSLMGPGHELRERMGMEASTRALNASRAELERLVHTYYDQTPLRKIGFWFVLLTSFGPLDLLWMGLGLVTAWKLGQGLI